MGKKRGRPTLLTPEVHQVLVEQVLKGQYKEQAALVAGIGTRTFQEWLERGRKDKRGRYRMLFLAVQKAEAQSESETLEQMLALAKENGAWQAFAWVLERKNPDRWGRKARVEVAGADKPLQIHQTANAFVATGNEQEYIGGLRQAARAVAKERGAEDDDGRGRAPGVPILPTSH